MTATLAAPDTPDAPQGGCCWLLAPLGWPEPRPELRQLHRLLSALADLTGAVAAAHQLTSGLAAMTQPPDYGWHQALVAIDVVAVGTTDPAVLARELTAAGCTQAGGHLRRGLEHRRQALQALRAARRTGRFAALQHRHMSGLLARVVTELDRAGQALAAADDAVITAARKARP